MSPSEHLFSRAFAAPRSLQSRIVAILLLLAFLASTASARTEAANEQAYLEHVKVLAAPDMEGRGAGTKGLQRASEYIQQEFKKLGLKPAGDSGGWLQPFTLTTGSRLHGKNQFTITEPAFDGNVTSRLKLNKQYSPISFSASGAVTAPLVFVGYGITALKDFGYDDYANIDVKGKIVVVLRYEPKSFSEKSGRPGVTRHAAIFSKAINAREHGAVAMILVNGELRDGRKDELIPFGRLAGPENIGIPLVQVTNPVAENWLLLVGKNLKEVQQSINASTTPNSFNLPDLRASLTVNVEKVQARVANVLGFLPGQTDEYIIIGAHYDHLGRGNVSSLAPSQVGQFHLGADDNASGTAGVLEVARILSQQRGQLKRGVLFMTFAGEELGLLGSAHWVKNPTLPFNKAVAMINMDMIGRMRDSKLYVGGVGTAAGFKSEVEKAAAGYHFNIDYSFRGSSSSDHATFVAKKIPVLFFFSGLHSDYHRPSDTWDKINAASASQVVSLVSDVAMSLVNAESAPTFVAAPAPTQAASQENPHAEAPDSASADSGAAAAGSSYGPYFGSVPDFGQEIEGVKFSDVRPDSPAAKAGLKAGDVLIQFGERSIRNLYDFTEALRGSQVGQTVEVKVMREGTPVTASVTLEARR
ncbi:MAG: M28 family peptidase [Candidatus Korobacteraceae bacterium]